MSWPTTCRLALVVACAAPAHAGTAAWEIERLAPCAAHVTPSPGGDWKTERLRGQLALSLPPSCERVEAKGFVHGGDSWRCGEIGVQVAWGIWGPSSFGEGVTTCAAEVGGTRVMIVREQADEGWIAVLLPTGDVHEPLLSASSKRVEDRRLAEAIVFSGRVSLPPDFTH